LIAVGGAVKGEEAKTTVTSMTTPRRWDAG
jgi:hypothetical protein